jgi:serine/threonine-protein kinase
MIGIGTQLGSHEITALLGKGGMGEVYRARDTKLKREVAIKFLPEEFSTDYDRASRFQREAELLASLNHPNIGAIYSLEEVNGSRFLVLELVEGQTLAERIARGPIPLDEALEIAKQICDALEAAHERGIIHRDLKPANVKITPEGKVKVLDFGLAKAVEAAPAGAVLPDSPTMLSGTIGGMIIGTAGYMSPEQAKGRPADKRSDVWAFGCILFEMLTGQTAFAGDDVSDTLAAVLRAEPDWRTLPANVPGAFVALIKRCLEKDRRQRVGDIAVIRYVLKEPVINSPAPADEPIRKTTLVRQAGSALVMFASGVALASSIWWILRPAPLRPVVAQFTIALPSGQRFTTLARPVVAVSPDGTQIVYAANRRLYVRSVSEPEAREIQGTQSTVFVGYPAFSPDGDSIAFVSSSSSGVELRRISVQGGAAVPIQRLDGPVANGILGLSWDTSGILFADPDKGIMRISPQGGKADVLIGLKTGESALGPQMLPDGRTLLFTYLPGGTTPDRWDKAQIVTQSLKTGERKTVVEIGTEGRYLRTGHLVYAVGGVLYAAPFDLNNLRTTGPGVRIVEGVLRSGGFLTGGHAMYGVSDGGTLAYLPGPVSVSTGQRDVLMVDGSGAPQPLKLPPASYEYPRISPDGTKLVVGSDDGTEATVWVYPLRQTVSPLKITFGGKNRFPIWSQDSKRVTFQSDRENDGGIFQQLADLTGPVERLTKPDQGTTHIPNSWSPDGTTLLLDVVGDSTYSLAVWSRKDQKIVPFPGVGRSSTPTTAVFSSDGHWVAYSTRERDQFRATVYVQPYPPNGTTKYQISGDVDGHHPLWAPGGKLIYNPGGRLVSVTVTRGPGFPVGTPEDVPGGDLVQAGPTSYRTYDVSPDGKFIVGVGSGRQIPSSFQINVILNWLEQLKQRVPVK